MREAHGFTENLVLHRFLAEHTLQLADLLLELAHFCSADDLVVRFNGFTTALGHATPPVKKLARCYPMSSGYVRDRHSWPIALLAEPQFLLSGEAPAPFDTGYNLDPFLRHSLIHRRMPMPYKLCHVSGRKWGRSTIESGSVAMRMFRTILEEYIGLAKLRRRLEKQIHDHLDANADYQRLRTVPGIGPIVALTILAEAGDLRRFSHYRKFLKYCGFDLSTSQSGQYRGTPQLSKRGNARLRCAFWMAARAAVAQRRNGFRKKYDDYTRHDPQNLDLRRKAYTAVAAKMARVTYGLIKFGSEYRHLTA